MSIDIPDYLSEDQAQALETVLERTNEDQETERETTFVGPAGSGKSTLLNEIVKMCGRHCVLGAPTGRAAVVMRLKTGLPATTIHRLLYGGAEYDKVHQRLVFHSPGEPCADGDLLVIDESSMIGTKIYEDIHRVLPKHSHVLWTGDKEQLRPIGDGWGPDLDHPHAELTKIHRQAEKSQILRYSQAIREGRGWDWAQSDYDPSDPNLQIYDDFRSAIEWLVDARCHNEDATLLTFTHRIRKEANDKVRRELGLWSAGSPFTVGDKMVVRTNNHAFGLMNGEVVTLTKVDRVEQGHYIVELAELPDIGFHTLFKHLEEPGNVFQEWRKECKLPREERELYLHFHYGQCLTVHSAQGSQWKRVGFIWDKAFKRMMSEDESESRRLLYTAVTRASDSLALFLI